MSRLFGQNGMKGMAVTEFTCELAILAGRAVAKVLADRYGRTKFFIAKDTRNSSDTIESALCAGICSMGADVELLGILPAPALAWSVRENGVSGGIMITASHANSDFNGIKLFSPKGYRLDESTEAEIENLINEEIAPVQRKDFGRISYNTNVWQEYVNHLIKLTDADLSGLKIVIDCGNGSTSSMAEEVFCRLGADVEMHGNSPDGNNINSSGSMHIESLMEYIEKSDFDCGIAFDGSGERCLAVDEKGNLIDGDIIIAVCAMYMKNQGLLNNNLLLATHANNFSLIQFAQMNSIDVVDAPAGERSMIQKMLESGCSIGGDLSGHIIFPYDMPSADGMLTGIKFLEILKNSGGKMSDFSEIIEKLPQVILNVPISRKFQEVWKKNKTISALIDDVSNELGGNGRVIIQETGKEPMIRIRIEGKDFTLINTMALRISETIRLKNDSLRIRNK